MWIYPVGGVLDQLLLVPQDELWLVGHLDRVQGHGAKKRAQDRAREAWDELVGEVDDHGGPLRVSEAV